jgi:hypothetical protein
MWVTTFKSYTVSGSLHYSTGYTDWKESVHVCLEEDMLGFYHQKSGSKGIWMYSKKVFSNNQSVPICTVLVHGLKKILTVSHGLWLDKSNALLFHQ